MPDQHHAKVIEVLGGQFRQHLGVGSDIDLDGYDDMPPELNKQLRAGYKGSYGFRAKIDIEVNKVVESVANEVEVARSRESALQTSLEGLQNNASALSRACSSASRIWRRSSSKVVTLYVLRRKSRS